jgi:hypothetical protein
MDETEWFHGHATDESLRHLTRSKKRIATSTGLGRTVKEEFSALHSQL